MAGVETNSCGQCCESKSGPFWTDLDLDAGVWDQIGIRIRVLRYEINLDDIKLSGIYKSHTYC
jgi:hypothetical protein